MNSIINGLKNIGYFGLNVHQRINAKVSKYFMYCTNLAQDYNYRAYWRKAKWGFYSLDTEGITHQTLQDIKETVNFYTAKRATYQKQRNEKSSSLKV
jgi:hypothetical protein